MDKKELEQLRRERAADKKDPPKAVNADSSLIFSAIMVFLVSVGFQILHWYIFEALEFSSVLLAVTPIPLVLGYFVVIQDKGRGHTLSKRFIFGFSCVLPLVFGLIMSAACYCANPDLSIFIGQASDSDTKLKITIALYSLRIVLTSLYLTIAALAIYAFSRFCGRK